MAQSGDGARPPSPRGEPFAFAPPLGLHLTSAMKGVRLKERLQGPSSGAEGAVWSVSAHCEDRGTEEQGKVGSRRSGACLVDSGLVLDKSDLLSSRYI